MGCPGTCRISAGLVAQSEKQEGLRWCCMRVVAVLSIQGQLSQFQWG